MRAARSTFDVQDPTAAAQARAQRRYNLPFSLKTNLRLAGQFVRRPNKAGSLVLFAVLGNVFNTKNVSGYTYSADYQQTAPTLFQRRLLYFGLVKTWQ